MAAPPLSKFLPEGTELPSSGALAVRIEKAPDGVRLIARDRYGWWFIAHLTPCEIDGRPGYSGVAVQQAVPDAYALPGENEASGTAPGPKPRGIGPKVSA